MVLLGSRKELGGWRTNIHTEKEGIKYSRHEHFKLRRKLRSYVYNGHKSVSTRDKVPNCV